MEKETILQQFGLNDKETNVYLAALTLGTCSITQLSKRAGLKRPTTYLIIEELLKKNLLISIPSGTITHYKAEKPSKLIEYLEEKKEKIKDILPDLESIYQKSSKQPKVRFYEGKDRLTKMYEEVFRSKEIWSMFSFDNYSDVFTEKENRHLFNILNRQGGIIYDLMQESKKAREYAQKKYRTGLSETKFLPRSFKIATDILVFDNKTTMVSLNNLMGVIIEDKDIADTHKTMIQHLWNNIK
ncbi:hypothetical protein KKA15_02420 [Patescibacteria group bacterium]|nr:hypothetical protein [Patescibacteria group bacterium]